MSRRSVAGPPASAGLASYAALEQRVESFIVATKHDAAPSDPDARLTVDVDLSILGAPDARFDEYESQIRQNLERWIARLHPPGVGP